MSQLDVTVAIPTFNGERRLPTLLQNLRLQETPRRLNWEVLVVDNRSTDGTGRLIRTELKHWQGHVKLRWCYESVPGVAFARRRAVLEARGELVAFLDDDNLPASDWVARAWEFYQQHPRAGAIASRIRGRYGAPPPPGFERISSFLGITDRGDEPSVYLPHTKALPPAAGLAVRRRAWLESVPSEPRLIGPVGVERGAGEDIEAALWLQKSGWEIWYNPKMLTEHVIPAERLSPQQLLSVARAAGLAVHSVRRVRWPSWFVPVGSAMAGGRDLFAFVAFWMRRRPGSAAPLVVQCEAEYLKGRLSGVLHGPSVRPRACP